LDTLVKVKRKKQSSPKPLAYFEKRYSTVSRAVKSFAESVPSK